MATSAASITKGVITFETGFFAQITNIEWDGIERESVPTSHMGTAAAGANKFGNMTFIPSDLVDPGTLTVDFNFNPDTLPPIASAAATCTVAIGDSATQATWAASGFMTSIKFTGPLGDKMTAQAKVKLSGNVTRTAGA
jgi:hypothetical protein